MPTLGLNVIVGPGEAGLLNRCLKSFNVKEMFDEIVVVNTSNDSQVDSVAKYFTDKIYNFAWETEDYPYGNFGGARDFARQKSTTDKIMWLDADDVLLNKYMDKWKSTVDLVKDEKYRDVMIWCMPYAIVVDDNGDPITWFKRERIFDREEISWKHPIHELMFPPLEMVKNAMINGMFITHLPSKPTYASAIRNVKILEHEYYNKKDADVQTKYFLGRDYIFTGQADKGIGLLTEIIQDIHVSYEMLYAIAMELVWFYAFGCSNPRPQLQQFRKENLSIVEGWCRMAIATGPTYAEPCVVLGDVYWYRGDTEAAKRMYMVAMKKQLGVGKFQSPPMYVEIPAERLSRIFGMKGSIGMALHYNRVALNMNKIPEYITQRRELANYLNEGIKNEFSEN